MTAASVTIAALWKRRRWVLDEIVLDLVLGEWNRETSLDESNQEILFRNRLREAREIVSSCANVRRFVTPRMKAGELRMFAGYFVIRGRAKTLWFRHPRPVYTGD